MIQNSQNQQDYQKKLEAFNEENANLQKEINELKIKLDAINKGDNQQ